MDMVLESQPLELAIQKNRSLRFKKNKKRIQAYFMFLAPTVKLIEGPGST